MLDKSFNWQLHMRFTVSLLRQVAHWVFSIAYFELAIKFGMLFGGISVDIDA